MWAINLPNTPKPEPLVRCGYCKEMVNPKAGVPFKLTFMCNKCVNQRSKR